MVYSGIASGSYYTHNGGGSNYLCMPKDPEYKPGVRYSMSSTSYSTLYGTEYQYSIQKNDHHNVPCAVCHVSTRSALLLIPAKYSCPAKWTMEYYGYLMSNRVTYRRTKFECVDHNMESLPDTQIDTNGALFYHVKATCNGLPCGPYNTNKELNCVVCTK